jgi:hypothetical protein
VFKFRYVLPDDRNVAKFVTDDAKPILQVMQTHLMTHEKLDDQYHTTHFVLLEIENPQWQTVETVYVDNEEYDKARGWSIPEPCMAKDVEV